MTNEPMINNLIDLRAAIQRSCDILDGEKLGSDKKRHQRNLIVQYLEQAKIEAGSLLRELQEESK